jgi:translation initiation factor 2 alpha subunit (eIF-2alpha)
MNFTPHTHEELQELHIQDSKTYRIEYINKDYYNGEETLEKATATAVINDEKITFIVPDPYGMDRFISEVRVLS